MPPHDALTSVKGNVSPCVRRLLAALRTGNRSSAWSGSCPA